MKKYKITFTDIQTLIFLYCLAALSTAVLVYSAFRINSITHSQSVNYGNHFRYHTANDCFRQGTDLLTEAVRRWLDQYHSTAAGKVLLSALPDAELEVFLAQYPLRQLTPRTICDPEELKAGLAEVRQLGYSVVRDESVFGISSLGVPVSGHNGKVVAAVSTSFSSYFLNDDYLQRQLTLLRSARQAIEKNLLG